MVATVVPERNDSLYRRQAGEFDTTDTVWVGAVNLDLSGLVLQFSDDAIRVPFGAERGIHEPVILGSCRNA
jgi:hypothetical protein